MLPTPPAAVDPMPTVAGTFDPAIVFGRASEVELEIGVGKGRVLLASATAHPERDYIGLEYATKYCRLVAERATRRGLANVRMIRMDARRFLTEHLPDRSLARVHAYFPDPWPKRRQHKRRLLDPRFAHLVARKLVPGGEMLVATDHADYFAEIELSFASETAFVRLPAEEPPPERLTNYEVKYRREGRPIHRAAWRLGRAP